MRTLFLNPTLSCRNSLPKARIESNNSIIITSQTRVDGTLRRYHIRTLGNPRMLRDLVVRGMFTAETRTFRSLVVLHTSHTTQLCY